MEQDDLRYSAERIWVRMDDYRQATIGLCEDFLEDGVEVRRLVLSAEGDELVKDDVFGRLTTNGKGVYRLYAPIGGEIVEVNEEALDTPEVIIEDPYQDGWLLRVDVSNMADFDELMTRDEYEDSLEEDALDDIEDDDEEDDDDMDDDDYDD